MDRPKPIAELVIQTIPMNSHGILIAAVSDDARTWIESEGPVFGLLQQTDIPYTMLLSVSLAYNPKQVLRYLYSYLTNYDTDDSIES